jgi:hypothetical protein
VVALHCAAQAARGGGNILDAPADAGAAAKNRGREEADEYVDAAADAAANKASQEDAGSAQANATDEASLISP